MSANGAPVDELTSGRKRRRVALYARVSTADQHAAMQLEELRAVAAQRGWAIVAEHVDVASGATSSRPELDKLKALVERGRVDVVAVWKFDRFARSIGHLVSALDDFRARGVDFVSIRDAVDTSTSAGRFVFTLIAAVAEFERELLLERTRAGVEAARRRGARIGRPPRNVDVEAAQALLAAGRTMAEVARVLNVGQSTLARYLGRSRNSLPDGGARDAGTAASKTPPQSAFEREGYRDGST